MSARPKVSVLLPCFNEERYVAEAIQSILQQTYADLELLVLDDGSTDSTPAIVNAAGSGDSRVRVLRSAENQGLIATLNRGVRESHGEFIARMDADDVAVPSRIARQVGVLEQRSEVDLLGTGTRPLGPGARRGRRPVRCREPGGARFMALLGTPVAHMTLLARASVMRSHPYGQSADSLHTEDYELFSRMLVAGVRIANLDEPLVDVRLRPEGVSQSYERLQISNFVSCSQRHLAATMGLRPPPAVHRVLVNRIDHSVTPRDLAQGLRLLDELERAFRELEPSSREEIRDIAHTHRADILIQAGLRGTGRVRAASAPLAARHARMLGSPTTWRYLVSKVRIS
jgi:glycosyltransferase involved in cell wall biosynthesis